MIFPREKLEEGRIFREITNPLLTPIVDSMNATRGIIKGPLLVIPLIYRNIQFRRIVRRHGEDAALLLWAHPPLNKQGKITLKFNEWEKQMIKEGYLHPTGGLTNNGLVFMRSHVKPEEIRKMLEQMEKERFDDALGF
jgi:hypothetical protein